MKELVISIGKFHTGDADNVIPEKAVMEGTIRVFDEELRALASIRLTDLARSIGRGLGCQVDVQIERGYDVLWNHAAQVDIVPKAAADAFGSDAVVETQPIIPVEDFSYYQQQVPSAYFFIGAKMEDLDHVDYKKRALWKISRGL